MSHAPDPSLEPERVPDWDTEVNPITNPTKCGLQSTNAARGVLHSTELSAMQVFKYALRMGSRARLHESAPRHQCGMFSGQLSKALGLLFACVSSCLIRSLSFTFHQISGFRRLARFPRYVGHYEYLAPIRKTPAPASDLIVLGSSFGSWRSAGPAAGALQKKESTRRLPLFFARVSSRASSEWLISLGLSSASSAASSGGFSSVSPLDNLAAALQPSS